MKWDLETEVPNYIGREKIKTNLTRESETIEIYS